MEQKFKYPLIKAFTKPFSDVVDHMKFFAALTFGTAFVLTLLAYAFGKTFLCSVSSFNALIHCNESAEAYITYFFLKLFILSSFLKIWYDKIYLNKEINKTYFKNNIKRFIFFFIGFILFIILNLCPIFSFYLLVLRVPNPVWQAEIGYFTVVSTGFIVPFVMLRFYANLAELIEGENFKNFKQTAENTCYQFSKILVSFAFVVVFSLVLSVSTIGTLRMHIFGNIPFYNLFSEYVFALMTLLIATLFINFIRVQKEIFLQDDFIGKKNTN